MRYFLRPPRSGSTLEYLQTKTKSVHKFLAGISGATVSDALAVESKFQTSAPAHVRLGCSSVPSRPRIVSSRRGKTTGGLI
ncbi:acetyltransferase, GNAT family [Aspergillus luchuensis]|uniref:Acetyltransferase, GNAT family n=1 Tax=Aspergillus kawachii TaxID=1069201 RepID=A0A146EY25_ASPKA|nr:acetyltransferase, GNAT family [Aspergillus luchuensis]